MCLELDTLNARPEAAPARAAPSKRAAKRAAKRARRATRQVETPSPGREPERVVRRSRRARKRAVKPVAPAAPAGLAARWAEDVTALVAAVEAGTLPRADWNHAAHLAVALAYARRDGPAAYERLRAAIQRYNRASGLIETATRGYHETITRAWFQLVAHFLDLFDEGQPLERLAADVAQVYGRGELFRHYSRERLLEPAARGRFVAPDLEPLPTLEPFTPEDRRWLAALEPSVARVPALARAL